MGNQVVEQLHDNTGVGWVFPEDTDAALKGVYDGSYYAAIIIGDDFSRSLFDFLDNGMNHPSVTYYENSKKMPLPQRLPIRQVLHCSRRLTQNLLTLPHRRH